MNLLEHLKDHQLIIVPDNLKQQILKKLETDSSHYSLKFMNLDTLKKHLFFDYDLQAISYLMEHYHLKTDVCKVYLENMYYIEDKEYKSKKLRRLLQLKKELEEKNLLFYDHYFQYLVSKNEVLIAGYSPLNRFQNRMLEMLEKWTNVIVVEENKKGSNSFDVYEFDTMEAEVDFVACSILDLVHQGVPLNKIKLTNVNEEYNNTIKRVFSYYHLPIVLEEPSIYSTSYIKTFLSKFQDIKSLEESFEFVNNTFPNEVKLSEKLLKVCNQANVLECSFSTKYELIVDLLKNTKIPSIKQKEAIEVVSFDTVQVEDDEYLFLLGMNQNIFPKLYKDEDYISDSLKEEVFLPTTKEKNQLSRISAINKMKSINHITLSYKLKSAFESYYPSSLLEELSINVIKSPTYSKYQYSNLSNKIKLAKKLDRYRKFGEEDPDISLLQSNYATLPYLTYQNQFTGIDKEQYLDNIKHKLLLSYTSMNQYNQCGFRYYLNYVLKLNPFEETFPTWIGNLYHKLLSMAFLVDFDFEREFTIYQKTKELTVNEAFLLKKLKKELKSTIEIIKEQQELTNFRQELYEQDIMIPIQSNIKVLFKGTIDKIMYQEKMGRELVSVIDYKTGNATPNLFQMPYGLNMQLPVYLYLVKKSRLFPTPIITGFYLQKVLHNEMARKEGVSQKEQKRKEMKLNGYSTTREDFLEQFDITYQNSELIKGMKLTSKGFSRYSKIVTEEEIEKIINLTEQKILETVENIIEAKFDINPKKIGKENVSCPYCPFADICYHKEEDVILLDEYHDLSFLMTGGDRNE